MRNISLQKSTVWIGIIAFTVLFWLSSFGCFAQSNWTNVGSTLQMKVSGTDTLYRFPKSNTSMYGAPFAASSELAKKLNVKDSLLKYVTPTQLALKEPLSNKQNSLATDGTGVKYPTVDAVNGGLSSKISKQIRVVYADDYTDSYTGIDVATGRNLGSAIYKGLEALNLVGGGTLILSNKTYYPVGGDIFSPLVYENMVIEGAKMPYFNSDATGLLEGSGTIILGSLCFITPGGQALKISNLGVDVGKNVCDTYYGGAATDGLCWAKPTDHNPLSPYTENAYAENITVIAKDVASPCHAFLFEGINGGTANNILTMYGFHGIVNKSKGTTLTNLRAYFHGGEGFIIKSDDYAISENVFAENVFIDNIMPPQGVTPYDTGSYDYGFLIQAGTSNVGYIDVGSVFVNGSGDAVGIKSEGSNSVSIVRISNINSNKSINAVVYSGFGKLTRVRIDNITAINTSSYVLRSSIPSSLGDNNTIGTIITATTPGDIKPIGVGLYNSSAISINYARWQDLETGYDIGAGSDLYLNEEMTDYVTKLVTSTKEPLYNTLSNNFDEKLNVTLKPIANATVLKSGSNPDYGWIIDQDELITGDWFLKRNILNVHLNTLSVSRSTGLVKVYNNLLVDGKASVTTAPTNPTDVVRLADLVGVGAGTPTITQGSTTVVGTGAVLTISGNNKYGVIALTTGTGITGGGVVFTVTLGGGLSYPVTCTPIIQCNGTASSSNALLSIKSQTATSWSAGSGEITGPGLSASTTYKWNYHVGGY